MRRVVRTGVLVISCWNLCADGVAAGENASDFMGIHQIEIVFHEAGTNKKSRSDAFAFHTGCDHQFRRENLGNNSGTGSDIGSIGGLRAPFSHKTSG